MIPPTVTQTMDCHTQNQKKQAIDMWNVKLKCIFLLLGPTLVIYFEENIMNHAKGMLLVEFHSF